MKGLKQNLAFKIFAWILSFILLVVFSVSVIAAVFMLEQDFHTKTEREIQFKAERLIASEINSKISGLYETYKYDNSENEIKKIPDAFADEKNWRFYITLADGELIVGNYKGEKATEYNFRNMFYKTEYWDTSEKVETEAYNVTVYVLSEKTQKDRFVICRSLISFAYYMRYAVYIVILVSVLGFFALAAFLFSSAGHKKGEQTVQKGVCEQVPFDIFTSFLGITAFLNFVVLDVCFNINDTIAFFIIPVLIFLDYIHISLWLKSMAVHIKMRTIFKEMACVRAAKYVCGCIASLLRNSRGTFRTLIITVLPCLVLLFFILIMVDHYLRGAFTFIWAICTLIFVLAALWHNYKLSILYKATEKMAKGELTHTVPTGILYGELKYIGENLNKINEGLLIAVNDKMKSEHFKTELITNVSHDLKTPLTSIINYVDLLSKLELDDKVAQEYIEILSRQSARLKKLTDDLLEASKASTGNIKMELSRCDIGVLLSQTVGEFSDQFEKAELTPIVSLPQQPVFAMVDGRRLYRVFENLMSNICKYSQPNTRAYLDVISKENNIIIRFRNISKDMLAVSGEELTERFVRGDSSRNTEGSGLGLSIAKSLIELQNGKFLIRVDGDLFDVTITFAAVEEEKD